MSITNITLNCFHYNKEAAEIYLQASDSIGRSLLFRFRPKGHNPGSLSDRLLPFIPATKSQDTANDLKLAISEVWGHCILTARMPFVIIDLDTGDDGHAKWAVKYETTMYQSYLSSLPVADLKFSDDVFDRYECQFVDRSQLMGHSYPRSTSSSAVVSRRDEMFVRK